MCAPSILSFSVLLCGLAHCEQTTSAQAENTAESAISPHSSSRTSASTVSEQPTAAASAVLPLTAEASVAPPTPAGLTHIRGPDFGGYLDTTPHESRWLPTEKQIRTLERLARPSLRAAIDAGEVRRDPPADLPDRLPSYARRYTGFLEGGKKRIGVAFYCPSEAKLASLPPDQVVNVRGGWSCFVRATYDLASQTFLTWSINAKR